MDGILELAKILKERDNNIPLSPQFGTVVSLPDVKIQINDNVVLTKSHITALVNLSAKNDDGNYIYLNSRVVLLPYNGYQKYILLGVVV